MALTQTESQNLAAGIAGVAKHYDLGVSEKAMDWTNLLTAVGTIYGTRFFAIRQRIARERRGETTASTERETSTSATPRESAMPVTDPALRGDNRTVIAPGIIADLPEGFVP